MIVNAQLNILNHGVWPYSNETPDMQVNAHEVKADWSVSTVTWNNQPSYNSVVLDYDIFEEINEATWRKFDITKIAKQWYEKPETNYGIMLKSANTTGSYAENGVKAYMYTERYNSVNNAYPQILLTYRNNKGLEDYWTYTSLSAGVAGSAYVNDYTGNLVFASNIISSNNELMSLNVDCVYNGYSSDVKYVSGKNNSNITVPGCGWRLSVQQTVISSDKYGLTDDAANNYPYVYTDGDGTEHYIYKKTEDDKTTYEDEDGLGLTLTIQKDGSAITGYTIVDKKDNKLIFNSQGNLIKSQNANGNYITVNYESTGKKLQSIVDGAGKIYAVTYVTDMDYIDYITDPSGRKIDFSYSNGTLIKISHPDGTTSNFTYDTADKSMITAKDNDNYQLTFGYTSAEKGKRVSDVTEYGNGVEGQKITFDRSKYNTTAIRTAGSDGVHGDNNDLITTYQFDNFGKTVTQQLKTADGTDSVAGVYNYTEKDVSSLKTANKVSSSAALGKNVVNYIKGGNAENITNWTPYTNSAVTSTLVSSSDAAYIGQKSIRINNSSVSSAGANANVYQDISGLTGEKTYTLSAYVKTENLAAAVSSSAGAYIALRYKNSGDEYEYKYSQYIAENTETSVNKGWRRLTVTVTLPENTTSVRAYLGLKNYTGKAYFDCIQLEKSSVANDFNLIENSSFEQYTSGLPDSWSTSSNIAFNQSGDTVYEGISSKYVKDGEKSMVIKGVVGQNKFISQYAYVYGNPNDTYIVSGWARANAVGSASNHESAKFQITIRIYYDDGNGGTYTEYKSPAKFNTTISGWQYTAQTFTLKSEEHPTYQPKAIRIVPVYYDQVNHGYFDHIQLIKDVAQSYVYDDEGNIVSVSANAEQKDDMEYDDSDLKTYTDVLGNKTTYTYDDKHNVTKATTPGGVKTSFTYNSKGQQTFSDIKNSAESVAIRTGTLYTEEDETNNIKSGAYVRVVSDENLYRTYYTYDMLKGLTTKVTNAKGVATNYTYDTNDRLKTVSSNGTAVNYTYSGNKLSTIKYGNDTYSFEYDNYGNIKRTLVNNKPLSTNTYGANNGVLEKTTYGNGAVRQYTYDSYGNLKSIKKANNGTLYSWSYDSSMTPLIHRDSVNDLKYNYSYDAIGRLVRQDISDNNTSAHIGSTEYSYDLRNNVTKVANEMGGRTISQWYKYSAIDGVEATQRYEKENLPVRYLISSTRYVDYTYDSLNRLKSKTFSLSSPLSITYSYLNSKRETDETANVTYKTTQIGRENIGEQFFKYAYDELGNITSVVAGTVNSDAEAEQASTSSYKRYEYDPLNQLTREDNQASRETYIYEYDGYGNIIEKRVYDRFFEENESDATLKETITYSYGADSDAGWKNLLRSYNGESIDYDSIGNPTTYRGATLTWNGRELKTYSKNGTSISYTYDADGLRGSKTVNSAKTTYQYVDGQLLYEDRDGTDIYYYYDSYGTPTAIRYHKADGTAYTFYLATNQLGDVIGIYNASGNMVVKYEYDAWGRIISTTDANGGALNSLSQEWSDINPFRYRGYYYDSETELYYLQSRYYDAEVGRFINSDSLVTTGDLLGFNTYAYCGNNPVNYSDPSGHFWKEAWNSIKDGAKKVGAWINNNVIQPVKKFFKPKTSKSRVKKSGGTIGGLVKTAFDAFSVEAGAGYGFGVSMKVGVVGFNASVKGNPIHFVITTNNKERGMFYTAEADISVETTFTEIYVRDSYKYRALNNEDLSRGYQRDIALKGSFSAGFSFYFLVGVEIEFSYDFKSIYDYIAIM